MEPSAATTASMSTFVMEYDFAYAGVATSANPSAMASATNVNLAALDFIDAPYASDLPRPLSPPKNSFSTCPHSSASTPLLTSNRWFSRESLERS